MSKIYINGKDNPPAENPLARFKSYSYYHVLAVCDSTDTATILASGTGEDSITEQWLHADNRNTAPSAFTESLGPWGPKTIKSSTSKQTGNYCILINGATDAGIVITKVTIQSLVAAGAVNNDRFSSMSLEGTIEISEPKGVSFMDIVARSCMALGKDAAHVTFVLKTFFVGLSDDDVIETIVNIVPLQFLATDVTGSFTEAGGQYTIQFVSMTNGSARLPQHDKMVRSPIISGGTLTETAEHLQDQVSTSYDTFYNCVSKHVANQETTLGYKSGDLSSKLSRVQYKIELAANYQTPAYKFINADTRKGNTGTCGEAATLTSGTDYSLESAIHHMMRNCKQVADDATIGTIIPITIDGKEVPIGTRIGYRIHSSVQTTAIPTGDKVTHTITYRVEPYPMPRDLIGGMFGADENGKDTDIARLRDEAQINFIDPNTIEFDYLYTGKNIDILDFDMKMNMGLAYLQTATISNTHKDAYEPLPPMQTLPDIRQVAQSAQRANAGIVTLPVFFSPNIELPGQRTTDTPGSAAGQAFNMTKQSSVEVLDVTARITGNLSLLQSVTASTASAVDLSVEQSGTIRWGYVPGFAKINISMPANNDDLGMFDGKYGTTSYTKPFWFDGYYYILGIEHVFDSGEFTQNLTMVGMPEKIANIATDKSDVQAQNIKNNSAVAECYSPGCEKKATNKTQQGSSSDHNIKTIQNAPTVQAAKTPVKSTGAGHPVIDPDQFDNAIKQMQPSDVSSWKASPEVTRNAIVAAAAGGSIPLSTHALMLALESKNGSGDPKSWNGTVIDAKSGGTKSNPGGAAGIFQFIPSTWNGLMPNNRVRPDQFNTASDPRFDPYLNARANVLFIDQNRKTLNTSDPTWLYLAHFAGPGVAAKVKKYIDSGQGDTPMTQVTSSWAKIVKANNDTYDINATAASFRGEIAAKMSSKIVDKNKLNQAISATTPAAAGATAVNTGNVAPTKTNTPSGKSGQKAGSDILESAPGCNIADQSTATVETPPAADPKGCPNSTKNGWSLGKSGAFTHNREFKNKDTK